MSSAGITSRSKAKVTPDQWTSMPLPVKILGILADALLEIQEQILEDDNQDSDWQHRFLDSDWEEVEAGDTEIEQELLYSAGTTSYSRPSHGYLDAMAKAFNEDEDYGYDDDLLSTADSLNEINWKKQKHCCGKSTTGIDHEKSDSLESTLRCFRWKR